MLISFAFSKHGARDIGINFVLVGQSNTQRTPNTGLPQTLLHPLIIQAHINLLNIQYHLKYGNVTSYICSQNSLAIKDTCFNFNNLTTLT